MILLDIIKKEFGGLRSDLISRYRRDNRRATGNWERELEVEVTGNEKFTSAKILGANYTQFMVDGRGPGKFPPLTKSFKDWMRSRGIDEENHFAVRKAIADKGTKLFRQGGSDMLDDVLNDDRIRGIALKVGRAGSQVLIENVLKKARTLQNG